MLKLCSRIACRLNSTSRSSPLVQRSWNHPKFVSDAKSSENVKLKNESPAAEWDKVYHLEAIAELSLAAKFKWIVGGASAIMIPVAYGGEWIGLLEPHSVLIPIWVGRQYSHRSRFRSLLIVNFTFSPSIYAGVSSVSIISLYSAALRNTIGMIYVCPKNKNIRFSYVDFHGKRQNYDTTVDNVIPSDDKTHAWLYQTVKFRSDSRTLKLPAKHGKILDFVLYEKLFGKLPQ